jgi:hypothetical protein
MGRVIKGQMIEKKRENACPFVVIETPRKQNEKRSSTIKYHKKYYYYYYYREGKRVGVARNRRVIKPSNKKKSAKMTSKRWKSFLFFSRCVWGAAKTEMYIYPLEGSNFSFCYNIIIIIKKW